MKVVRASGLIGWSGEPDPYVKLEMFDPFTKKVTKQKTSVMFNDDNPR